VRDLISRLETMATAHGCKGGSLVRIQYTECRFYFIWSIDLRSIEWQRVLGGHITGWAEIMDRTEIGMDIILREATILTRIGPERLAALESLSDRMRHAGCQCFFFPTLRGPPEHRSMQYEYSILVKDMLAQRAELLNELS